MTPRPKEITQWANLMTSNHKRDEFTTKKKDGKLKSFEAQKPTERKDLASLDQGVEESPKERSTMCKEGQDTQRQRGVRILKEEKGDLEKKILK